MANCKFCDKEESMLGLKDLGCGGYCCKSCNVPFNVFKCVGCKGLFDYDTQENRSFVKSGFCCEDCSNKLRYKLRKSKYTPTIEQYVDLKVIEEVQKHDNIYEDYEIKREFVRYKKGNVVNGESIIPREYDEEEYSDFSEEEMRAIDAQNSRRNVSQTHNYRGSTYRDDSEREEIDEEAYSDFSEEEMRAIDAQNSRRSVSQPPNYMGSTYRDDSEREEIDNHMDLPEDFSNCDFCSQIMYYTEGFNVNDGKNKVCMNCYNNTPICNGCNSKYTKYERFEFGIACSKECKDKILAKKLAETNVGLQLENIPNITIMEIQKLAVKDKRQLDLLVKKFELLSMTLFENNVKRNKELFVVKVPLDNESYLIVTTTSVFIGNAKTKSVKLVYSTIKHENLENLEYMVNQKNSLGFLLDIFDGRRSIKKYI